MLEALNSFVVGFFGLVIFVCLIFGSTRGHRIRRVNSHVVFFFLCHIVALYLIQIWASFELSAWSRDTGPIDISIGRFLKSFLVIITFTLLATYRMKEDALDLGLHTTICITTSAMLYMSVQSFSETARHAWLGAAVTFFALLILHILREGMHPDIRNPMLVRFLSFFMMSYIIFYLFASIACPYHQDIMSLRTYEILMTIADIITVMACSVPIVHYSWALTPHQQPILQAGDIRSMLMSGARREHITRLLHTQ